MSSFIPLRRLTSCVRRQLILLRQCTIRRFLSASPDLHPSIGSLCNELKAFPPGSKSLRHLDQLGQFVSLLHRKPECAREAWDSGVVPTLVELSDCGQVEMESQARMALSLLGYPPPYAGKGLRILSIDGGGTRWVVNRNLIFFWLDLTCSLP